MALRVSGINSGLDTESLVKELVSAYSYKTESYEKEQTKLDWKRESWKDLNADVYSLYTSVSNLRFSSAYSLKTATSSNPAKATVSASSDAINVSQKLNILSTAQTSYVTGGKLKSGINADAKLSDLGYDQSGEGTICMLGADGKKQEIKVTKDMSINDFLTAVKKTGVNASFDASTSRIFVSAKNAGADNDFSIVGDDEKGRSALAALGLNVSLYEEDEDGVRTFSEAGKYYQEFYSYYKESYTALDGTEYDDPKEATKAYLKDLEDTFMGYKKDYDTANTKHAQAAINLSKAKDAKKEYAKANVAVTEFQKKYKEINGLDEDEPDLADIESAEDIRVFDAESGLNKYGMTEAQVDKLVEQQTLLQSKTSEELDEAVADAQAEMDTQAANMKQATKNMDNAKLKDLFMDDKGTIYDSTRRELERANYYHKVLDAAEKLNNDEYGNSGAVQVHGVSAEITLNGVSYKSNTNSFTINGLTINALSVTGEGDENAIILTTSTDTQGIYDKVKDFLTQYNEVINKITKLYNADSARDYEPLTDEEKDAMSDTQIEKWETKIKDSLLRRDTTLGSLMTAMMSAMSSAYEVNGKKYTLSSFGIQTMGFLNAAQNEQNAYHIDGDADDENTANNKDKLMDAINNDPETVTEFLKSLSAGLYSAVDKMMKSSSLSSAYKVYNDKELDKQYDEYTDMIKKWEKKVSDKEEYYYKKFSAMETALGKMNSQQTTFTNMLG